MWRASEFLPSAQTDRLEDAAGGLSAGRGLEVGGSLSGGTELESIPTSAFPTEILQDAGTDSHQDAVRADFHRNGTIPEPPASPWAIAFSHYDSEHVTSGKNTALHIGPIDGAAGHGLVMSMPIHLIEIQDSEQSECISAIIAFSAASI